MPAEKCSQCDGAADDSVIGFRSLLVDLNIGQLIRHRETWTSRSGSLVVMFDESGNWFVRGGTANSWEAIGHGLQALKEHLNG